MHNLRPDVRVVTRLRNAAVSRAVAQVTGPDSVLDVAQLAAPSMVEACLRSTEHDLKLGDSRFALVAVPAERESTLRERYGDLAPVAVVEAGTGSVALCPGRDHEVHPGDVVHVIGTPDQFAGLGIATAMSAGPARRRRHTRPVRSLHPLRRDTRFVADDVAYLVGPYEELLSVLRRDAAAPSGQA